MIKYLLFIGLIILLYTTASKPVFAQNTACAEIYGGGKVCEKHPNLSVNKQILENATKQFRENLAAKSNYFSANEEVVFKVVVRNTSNETLKNITVNDVIPASLTYRSGNGNYDQSTRRFSATIAELSKGQQKIYTINTTANSSNSKNVCIVNQVTVMQNRQIGSDNVTFCLNGNSQATKVLSGSTNTTKGGLPIYGQPNQKQTPQTGPEIIGFLSLPVMGGLGIYLHKYSRRYRG